MHVIKSNKINNLFLGSYTNHEFECKLTLTSFDQMPEQLDKHFYVEFTQPATAISNTVLRYGFVILHWKEKISFSS